MSEKISNEVKAKFFAQYIGQNVVGHECDRCNFTLNEISFIDLEVGIYGDWSGGTNPQTACNDVIGIDAVWLNLRPVEAITDDELLVCYHLHSGAIGYDYTQDFAPRLTMAKHWIEQDGFKTLLKYRCTSDYLVSIGVITAFTRVNKNNQPLTLEPSDLISMNWAKTTH